MERPTALAAALYKAAVKVPDKLGIEHHIRYQGDNTRLGVKSEPDFQVNSHHYQGVYNPASKKQKSQV